jgi:hypothetical protein
MRVVSCWLLIRMKLVDAANCWVQDFMAYSEMSKINFAGRTGQQLCWQFGMLWMDPSFI